MMKRHCQYKCEYDKRGIDFWTFKPYAHINKKIIRFWADNDVLLFLSLDN